MNPDALELVLVAIHDLRDDVKDMKTDLKDDLSGVRDHLRELNGRTRGVESAVEVHRTVLKVVGAILLAIVPTLIVVLFK